MRQKTVKLVRIILTSLWFLLGWGGAAYVGATTGGVRGWMAAVAVAAICLWFLALMLIFIAWQPSQKKLLRFDIKGFWKAPTRPYPWT